MWSALVFLTLPVGYNCNSLVQPEVLVVVDSALHSALGEDILTTTQYVRNFWSAVNLRFRTLSDPAVELVVVGLAVGKYFYSRERDSWDLVVTMTGQDLCQRKSMSSKCNSATAGYAYVGGACVVNSRKSKVNAVALVQDDGGYGGVIVAAHEVAHLLGAPLDGDPAPRYVGGPGARSCPWSDGFIMSDRRRGVRGLGWSQCSKDQIRHFLSSSTASCLWSKSRTPSTSTLSLYSSTTLLAPHVTSADDQCRKEAGPGSRACFSDKRLCTQLFCLQPSTGGCVAYRPAVEGTQCGKRRICVAGLCKKTTIAAMFTESTTLEPKITKTVSTKSRTIRRKETNVNQIRRSQKETSPKKGVQVQIKEALPSFLPLTSSCIDETGINVRGV